MITSKSPRRVFLTAHHVAAAGVLPRYSSKYSRHDFTLPQLFACLVLKEFERKDYRGAEQLLTDWPALGREVGMDVAPDHTTLKRASDRLLRLPKARRLLDRLVTFARACKVLGSFVALAAMDASGFESRHVSAYFVRRRARGRAGAEPGRGGLVDTTYRRFPKLGLVADTRSHLILSFAAGTGPGPDHPHFERCLFHAWRRAGVRKVVADAGYDSEGNHRLARLDMGVRTVIPPLIGRPTAKPPSGRWRRVMRRLTGTEAARRRSGYSQRWQAETVNSMMKRNQGSALRARTHHTRSRELALRVLTHDLAVLRPRIATEQVIPTIGLEGTLAAGIGPPEMCSAGEAKQILPEPPGQSLQLGVMKTSRHGNTKP